MVSWDYWLKTNQRNSRHRFLYYILKDCHVLKNTQYPTYENHKFKNRKLCGFAIGECFKLGENKET